MKKEEVIEIIKVVSGIAASIGASAIVAEYCKPVTQGTKGLMKICCVLGGAGLASIIGGKAGEHVEGVVEDMADLADLVTPFVNKATKTEEDVVEE